MNGNYQEAGNGITHGAIIADTATVAGNGTVAEPDRPPARRARSRGDHVVDHDGAGHGPVGSDVPGSWQQLQ